MFNCNKTKAIYFSTIFLKLSNFSIITNTRKAKGVKVEFVSKGKYLGKFTICDNLSDDYNIKA